MVEVVEEEKYVKQKHCVVGGGGEEGEGGKIIIM